MDDDMKFEVRALVTAGLIYAGVVWLRHLTRMRKMRWWAKINDLEPRKNEE